MVAKIKAEESFGVYLMRKLFEFAQWIAWDSLANYLDDHYHFTRPIDDKEIEPLILQSEKPCGSHPKMAQMMKPNQSKTPESQTPSEPLPDGSLKQKDAYEIQAETDEDKQITASTGSLGKKF